MPSIGTPKQLQSSKNHYESLVGQEVSFQTPSGIPVKGRLEGVRLAAYPGMPNFDFVLELLVENQFSNSNFSSYYQAPRLEGHVEANGNMRKFKSSTLQFSYIKKINPYNINSDSMQLIISSSPQFNIPNDFYKK